MLKWRGSMPRTRSGQWAAQAAAGLARGQRTAGRGRTVCCSHTESGSALARLLSACAWAGSKRWLPERGRLGIKEKQSYWWHRCIVAMKTWGVCVCSDRAEGLIALFDDVLQLPQHRDLCVFQLQLLGGGICYACTVGGLRLIWLRTDTFSV